MHELERENDSYFAEALLATDPAASGLQELSPQTSESVLAKDIVSYAVGAFILGRPLSIPEEGVELLKDPHLLTRDYYRRLFVQSWSNIVWPFAIGGTILSVVCSVVAYPITLWAVRKHRLRRNRSVS